MRELDIVALATIADMVPLHGVNRAFVRQGLRKLDALERPGLAASGAAASATAPFLVASSGFHLWAAHQCGGRVGRCDLGARLLALHDVAEADAIALELDRHNRERQAIEAHILEPPMRWRWRRTTSPFLLLGGDGWHAGVVGIIAGRLKERHARPALVAGFDGSDENAIGRGSARSVAGVDLGAIIPRGATQRDSRDWRRSRNGGGILAAAEPARRVR
jgi:single-stranded-DNA-specific exonuclease